MQIAVASQGKYSAIKGILLVAMTTFIGPAVFSAIMNAMSEGDTTRYLMALGLLIVGIVLVLIYVLLCVEEDSEPVKKAKKKAVKEEPAGDDPPVEKDEDE